TDFSHPVLFDHPADHVPGMLLLEAARQSAHAATHPRPGLPTSLDATFTQYVELDTPCWIDRTPTENHKNTHHLIHVQALQNDTPAFTATIALTSP
ncbi:AfsA-related hotdog domain-containing protein, partial [Streptomyces humidus]|uniref:AfsA-related hotdog domain-containing protein n=1 Tax=Streptomyces humidus TaxID=52259 RepID=UPI00227D92D2